MNGLCVENSFMFTSVFMRSLMIATLTNSCVSVGELKAVQKARCHLAIFNEMAVTDVKEQVLGVQ